MNRNMNRGKEHRDTTDEMNGNSEWAVTLAYCKKGEKHSGRKDHWVRLGKGVRW